MLWGIITQSNWLSETGINIYKTITGYGILAIWFIPSYFIACWITAKTFRLSMSWQFVLMLLWASVGMAGSCLFDNLKEILSSRVYTLVYFPVAALLRGVACAFYVVLGRLVYVMMGYITNKRGSTSILVAIALASLGFNIWLSQSLAGVNFSLLRLGGQPYMSFVCGTLGSIWVIILFYLLRGVFPFPVLQYIGRKSLIIMGTHMSLLLTTLVPPALGLVIGKPEPLTVWYYMFGVLCVVVIILLELPVIRLFDGRLKFLVTKTR